ncbi:SDR family NAD(P)-dependent oxidoreductase [Isoptericola sp. BMS4]|uniref:SDR family NAD(P)-dependent oxidoreductase n=1 Tax=Isoptericola sp. BMS4 TaxID=2527875 RepID=UPI00142123CA|nr:SDR family NAD(P)-dependent oxidoreductase [Isoptericola sp. BMS4]
MTHRFENRVVLVTGAAHGIGAATARRLHAEGAAVVLADVDADAARRVADELDGNGPGRALAVPCDLTDTASVDAAVAAAVDRFGRLEALVNVAGGARAQPGLAGGVSDADWSATVDLNLTGPARCVRAAIPHLTSRGGAIVLVSSVNGLQAFGDEAYSAAKAGLSSMAQNLAVELGPRQVRVNVVAPGTVRTRVWDHQGGPGRMEPLYPLGRVGEPEDVAAAIAFLASDDAAWITGVTLPVDGGALAGPLQRMLAPAP